jgi:transcription antitermination factor NusG
MWHVVQAQPRGEKQICSVLRSQDLETCVPEFKKPARTRPGSVRDRRSRLVFPGYVFFRVWDGFSQWDQIRWAPGVRGILTQDGVPGRVEDSVLSYLQKRLAEGELRPPRSQLGPRAGDRVSIKRGPLAAVDAIFEREIRDGDQVEVLIQMMGRPTSLRINRADLAATAS